MTDTPMESNLPEPGLACSLDGGEQAARVRWLEQLRRRLLGVVRNGDRVTALFAATDETEAELRELAAAEAQCCPFLTFEVARENDRLQLAVSGPPEAKPIVETMFEAPQ